MYVLFLVICIAMGFGIVNTLLMAIMERIREFGIMMALGVRPQKIFRLVITESVLLCFCGLVLGNLISYFLVLSRIQGFQTATGGGFKIYLMQTQQIRCLCERSEAISS